MCQVDEQLLLVLHHTHLLRRTVTDQNHPHHGRRQQQRQRTIDAVSPPRQPPGRQHRYENIGGTFAQQPRSVGRLDPQHVLPAREIGEREPVGLPERNPVGRHPVDAVIEPFAVFGSECQRRKVERKLVVVVIERQPVRAVDAGFQMNAVGHDVPVEHRNARNIDFRRFVRTPYLPRVEISDAVDAAQKERSVGVETASEVVIETCESAARQFVERRLPAPGV